MESDTQLLERDLPHLGSMPLANKMVTTAMLYLNFKTIIKLVLSESLLYAMSCAKPL